MNEALSAQVLFSVWDEVAFKAAMNNMPFGSIEPYEVIDIAISKPLPANKLQDSIDELEDTVNDLECKIYKKDDVLRQILETLDDNHPMAEKIRRAL